MDSSNRVVRASIITAGCRSSSRGMARTKEGASREELEPLDAATELRGGRRLRRPPSRAGGPAAVRTRATSRRTGLSKRMERRLRVRGVRRPRPLQAEGGAAAG